MLLGSAAQAEQAKDNTWAIKADYIEACSCHLFCPCYFQHRARGRASL